MIRSLIACLVLAAFPTLALFSTSYYRPVGTAGPQADSSTVSSPTKEDPEFKPVDNMHHFMEYICDPSYQKLKAALVSEPENIAAWKPIKVNSLILAETTSLVAERCLEEERVDLWKEISYDVYESGKKMYKASRKRKFADVKKYYAAMIDGCNRCHQEFDDGDHQLEK